MPKNKVEDLRNLLFETMERLMDDDDQMDVDRARGVADVAKQIIDSAKVEVSVLKLTGRGDSEFMNATIDRRPQLKQVPQPQLTPLGAIGLSSYEDLCTRCPLPDCNETSPDCLIQIERKKAA